MGFWIFLIGVMIVVLLFCLYSYKLCFYAPKKRYTDLSKPPNGEQYLPVRERMERISRIMEASPCQWVSTTSRDGLTLWGRLYAYHPGAPLMLIFHGYRSTPLRDCAGGFALSQKLGLNVLAVDQRAHGRSDGRTITFGVLESDDCRQWIDFAANHFGKDTPIILSGISMGAATVLMAAATPLNPAVKCIMADCPYDSPAGIICKVAGDMGYPQKLAYPYVWLSAAAFGGFRIDKSSAVEAVQSSTVPILLIHGEDDRFVPCAMSHRIYQSNPAVCQLHTFPDAGHGLCYLCDPRRYEKICVEFLSGIPALKPWLKDNEFVKSVLE